MSIRTQTLQTNFTAGELSPKLEGRTDLAKYFNAAKTLENFFVLPYGGAFRRPGSRFVAETKYSAKKSRLMSFQFSTTQAYILEFGDKYIRFYKDRGVIMDPVATTTPYEIVSPYGENDIFQLQFAQSADVLYIAHPSYPPQKLSRYDHNDWTIDAVDFFDGPYLDSNVSNVTLTASATTGNVTLTAACPAWAGATQYHVNDYVTNGGKTYKSLEAHTSSAAFATDLAKWELQTAGLVIFQTGHVGSLWQKVNTTTLGCLKITEFINGATVKADVIKTVVAAATTDWSEGSFSGVRGYPSAVSFYEQRIYWGGTRHQPQTIFASKVSLFEDFGVSDPIVDDDALNYTLYSEQVNVIRWLIASKLLFVGTSGGYFTIQSGSAADAITPTNIVVRREATYGASIIQAEKIGNAMYFSQNFGRKIREINYQYLTDGYVASDTTILSEQVTESGIVDMDYQMVPFNILWCIRNDGQIALMTREAEQEVTAWYRFKAVNGKYKSIAIIPGVAEDEPWVIVERTIDGVVKKYVEYFEAHEWGEDQEDCFFIDSGLTYSGAPATVMTGLGHLEGQQVTVLADGATHPMKTVSGGSITLNYAASVVQIGLPYTSVLVTNRPELGDNKQTSQGKLKRITKLWARLYKSLGFSMGSEAKQDPVTFRNPSVNMDTPVPLFTGDKPVLFPGGYSEDSRVEIISSDPLPLTVSAIVAAITIHDA